MKRASTKVELAQSLGVSRRTLHNWFQFPDHPRPAANGSHDIEAWKRYRQTRGLGPYSTAESVQLKERRLAAQVARLEYELQEARSKYVLRSDVRAVVSMLAQIQREALRQVLCGALPAKLVGLGSREISATMLDTVDDAIVAMRSRIAIARQ